MIRSDFETCAGLTMQNLQGILDFKARSISRNVFWKFTATASGCPRYRIGSDSSIAFSIVMIISFSRGSFCPVRDAGRSGGGALVGKCSWRPHRRAQRFTSGTKSSGNAIPIVAPHDLGRTRTEDGIGAKKHGGFDLLRLGVWCAMYRASAIRVRVCSWQPASELVWRHVTSSHVRCT